ncbi:MAG: hypothetical protein GXN98_02700 [Euryarchaeota archaeon]|nr:hypothetical protein [Euryarchaeota archaeon]
MSLRIIPVLDLMRCRAVHALRGERKSYGALSSIYGSTPLEIARNLPWSRLYVADLDGIMHGKPCTSLLEELCRLKRVLLDTGARHAEELELFAALGCTPVIGSETAERELVQSAAELREAYFSLDVKHGRVLSSFLPEEPQQALEELESLGAENVIYLRLDSVGTLSGGWREVLQGLEWGSRTRLYCAGGVRVEELGVIEELGAEGVLLGTAVHRGLLRYQHEKS